MEQHKFVITVQIVGYKRETENEIKRVCMVEWAFREDDFMRVPAPCGRKRRLLEASALGTILDDENIQEIVARIERAVWRANGGVICHVECQVSKMNEFDSALLPCEEVESLVA